MDGRYDSKSVTEITAEGHTVTVAYAHPKDYIILRVDVLLADRRQLPPLIERGRSYRTYTQMLQSALDQAAAFYQQ